MRSILCRWLYIDVSNPEYISGTSFHLDGAVQLNQLLLSIVAVLTISRSFSYLVLIDIIRIGLAWFSIFSRCWDSEISSPFKYTSVTYWQNKHSAQHLQLTLFLLIACDHNYMYCVIYTNQSSARLARNTRFKHNTFQNNIMITNDNILPSAQVPGAPRRSQRLQSQSKMEEKKIVLVFN